VGRHSCLGNNALSILGQTAFAWGLNPRSRYGYRARSLEIARSRPQSCAAAPGMEVVLVRLSLGIIWWECWSFPTLFTVLFYLGWSPKGERPRKPISYKKRFNAPYLGFRPRPYGSNHPLWLGGRWRMERMKKLLMPQGWMSG